MQEISHKIGHFYSIILAMTIVSPTIIMIVGGDFMFNDFYGIYKDARDAAWRFLIDYHVDRLPVDLKAITDMLGIKVVFDDNNILYPNQKGTTLTDESATYIIIRRGGTPAENKYTVIHELGHGYFGHPLVDSKYGKTFAYDNQYEYQAERFAVDVLAPACVLWGLDLHTAKDISEVCNISMSSAQIRAERMDVLYQRNRFLTSPLERQVFSQFSDFIKQHKLR